MIVKESWDIRLDGYQLIVKGKYFKFYGITIHDQDSGDCSVGILHSITLVADENHLCI